jgi:hypothetical protein
MHFNAAAAAVCILACVTLGNAQSPPPPPPNIAVVQLQDLSQARQTNHFPARFFGDCFHVEAQNFVTLALQARKDLASAFVNMSFVNRGEMKEAVMFAGGDYARSGCSVHFLPQRYNQTSVLILRLGFRSHRFVH